jgi:hypothetical protein
MRKLRSKQLYIYLMFASGIFLWSCGGADMSNSKEEKESAMDSTGWNYHEAGNGGFNKVPYDEQETSPGLVMIERDSLEKMVMVADTEAMKQSVIQKLKDFYGLLEINMNNRYDNDFRKEAGDQIKHLLIDPEKTKLSDLEGRRKMDELNMILSDSIYTFTDSVGINARKFSCSILKIDSVTYKGILSYSRDAVTYQNGLMGTIGTTMEITEFLIQKKDKKFGNSVQTAWTCLLGNTRSKEK